MSGNVKKISHEENISNLMCMSKNHYKTNVKQYVLTQWSVEKK